MFGSNAIVKKVEANQFGIEVGKKQRRGHVHVIFTIRHYAAKYSVSKLRERFETVLNKIDTWSKGWYVNAKLLPLYQKNYTNKVERHQANQKFKKEANQMVSLELDRLNDPRDMIKELNDEGSTIYKLANLIP